MTGNPRPFQDRGPLAFRLKVGVLYALFIQYNYELFRYTKKNFARNALPRYNPREMWRSRPDGCAAPSRSYRRASCIFSLPSSRSQPYPAIDTRCPSLRSP